MAIGAFWTKGSSEAVGTILMVSVAAGLAILFYAQTVALVSSNMSFSVPKHPPTIVFSAYDYNADTGVAEICVYVSSDAGVSYEHGMVYLYDSADRLVAQGALEDDTLEFSGKDIRRSCANIGSAQPPGEYTVKLTFDNTGLVSRSMTVPVQCYDDSECPDVIRLSGNVLELDDMGCLGGYCTVVDSASYVCDESNAMVCSSLTLPSGTYYCEVHGSDTLWLETPTEFLDDLNDNDCDGTVELGCDSCKSCTHDLNDVAPSIASTGKNVLVVLLTDLAPDSSDITYFNGYFCSGGVCILATNTTLSSEAHIAFDGNGHQVTLTGEYVVDTYSVGGTGYLEFNNLRVVGGGICFDDSPVPVRAAHIDVKDGSCAYLDISSEWYDVNYSCASVYFDREACVVLSRYTQLTHAVVKYPKNMGIDATGKQYSLIDVNLVRTGTGYDFYLAPRFPTISNMFCSNGKEYLEVFLDGNSYALSPGYCGYMLLSYSSGDCNVDLNGVTLEGGGLALDGANTFVIFGPGAVSDAYAGVTIGNDVTSLIFDLSHGDINLCGNHTAVDYTFARPTCRNCGIGHYIYANSDDFSKFDCDSNCLRAC